MNETIKQPESVERTAEAPFAARIGSVTEHCWWCSGMGESPAIGGGYSKCLPCKGTGYGESLQSYWKRMRISPNEEVSQDAGRKNNDAK